MVEHVCVCDEACSAAKDRNQRRGKVLLNLCKGRKKITDILEEALLVVSHVKCISYTNRQAQVFGSWCFVNEQKMK